MELVVSPIVPVADIVILLPPVKPMLVLAEEVEVRSERLLAAMSWRALDTLPSPMLVLADEVLVRSERLLAVCRKKEVLWLAADPRFKEELEVIKVRVAPLPVMESKGPEVAKVKEGPVAVPPWAEIVVVAAAEVM